MATDFSKLKAQQEAQAQPADAAAKNEDDAARADLLKRADDLGIKGIGDNWKTETIAEKVEEAEKAKAGETKPASAEKAKAETSPKPSEAQVRSTLGAHEVGVGPAIDNTPENQGKIRAFQQEMHMRHHQQEAEAKQALITAIRGVGGQKAARRFSGNRPAKA